MLIDKDAVVSMHYKLTDDDGNLLDSSEGREPLKYLHGAGNIIPGLEKALVGQTVGAALDVRVEPPEAYGVYEQELVQNINKSAFQDQESIAIGMAFEAQGQDGTTQRIVVTAVEDDHVTIDGNHPLAGVALNFSVEITEVRQANEEEITHGHAH